MAEAAAPGGAGNAQRQARRIRSLSTRRNGSRAAPGRSPPAVHITKTYRCLQAVQEPPANIRNSRSTRLPDTGRKRRGHPAVPKAGPPARSCAGYRRPITGRPGRAAVFPGGRRPESAGVLPRPRAAAGASICSPALTAEGEQFARNVHPVLEPLAGGCAGPRDHGGDRLAATPDRGRRPGMGLDDRRRGAARDRLPGRGRRGPVRTAAGSRQAGCQRLGRPGQPGADDGGPHRRGPEAAGHRRRGGAHQAHGPAPPGTTRAGKRW
jgi:hypothetical protein